VNVSPKSSKSWVVIAGPTASGKSALGMELARQLNGEIVSCDSVQVYRGFDIGSAKPSAAERREIPHHLIDVVSWRDQFDTGTYGTTGRKAIADILRRGRLPVIVGGSGLYLRALQGQEWHGDLPKDEILRADLEKRESADLFRELQKLDPGRAAEVHPNDRFRIVRALEIVTLLGHPLRDLQKESPDASEEAYVVVLEPERAALHQAISSRTAAMVAAGLLPETQALLDEGCPQSAKPMMSIGYRQAAEVLTGGQEAGDLIPMIEAATRQYAKRQTTWFKSVKAAERLPGSPGAFGAECASGLIGRIQSALGLSSSRKS